MIRGVRRLRDAPARLPDEVSVYDGLAFSLWLPERREPDAGVVILHGAGSAKESHHDFARALVADGLAALAFDARGHGASLGPLDGRAIADIVVMAKLLRERCGGELRVALRGSSLGGYLAIVAAAAAGARAVVAICPAGAEGLRRGLGRAQLDFAADVPALDVLLAEHDRDLAADALEVPVLVLHAEGDERVPVQSSIELRTHLHHPGSRLIVVPGGHHRSIQHDEELQAVSLRFLKQVLASSVPG